MRGANLFPSGIHNAVRKASTSAVCIFISHSSRDKEAARNVAEYIMDQGLDVYFDEWDIMLQGDANDPETIVRCIQDGLKKSTHALCLISEHVLESQWVPYEIGFAHSLERPLALLVLKDVKVLPEFYRISKVLPDIWDLENYINELRGLPRGLVESTRQQLRKGMHPLARFVEAIRTDLQYR